MRKKGAFAVSLRENSQNGPINARKKYQHMAGVNFAGDGPNFGELWETQNVKPILRHRKIIGEAIRHSRKQANLTQEKLAERVDLHWKYIGEVERGEKIISIEALLRIAKVVKVPASDFLSGL